MLVKSKVKYIQSLSHKKQRDEDGVFVAEGPKIINELLTEKNIELVELYGLPETLQPMAAPRSKMIETDAATLGRISLLSTPNQVLGIFRKPKPQPANIEEHISLLLDNIQDPGNMGSIIRCADWFGIKQVICSRDCADVFGPKTVQSTMGSIARVNVLYEDLVPLLSSHKRTNAYAATLDGDDLYKAGPLDRGIIVIGNESKGISSEILSLVNHKITIPKTGRAESLNAAVATGIILSHLVR